MYDNNTTRLRIRLQNHHVIFGLFLINASIGIFPTAFAASISAPLGVTAIVVNSCKFSTASSASTNANTATNVNPVMDLACAQRVSPTITVYSGTLQPSAAPTGPTVNAAGKVAGELSVGASLNQIVTRSQNGRVAIAPEMGLVTKTISSAEQNKQGDGAGNHADFVIVTVNF